MLSELIKRRKKSRKQIKNELDCSYDSLKKYIDMPEKMDGDTRGRFAAILGISIDDMDDIVNGKMTQEKLLKL